MCRMIGVVFRGEFPMDSLADLRHVSEIGQVPGEDEPGHRDGWGIVSFMKGSPRYIGRSPRPAHIDPSYDAASADVAHLESPNILMAHVRAASAGTVSLQNTHPFVVDGIVLGHNGTIKGFRPETTRKPKGETDSERLALLVADRYEESNDLVSSLKKVIQEDVAGHEYSAMVLLVSDGKTLCGYRDYTDPERAGYYDLRISRCDDYVALYQETAIGYAGKTSSVGKHELVSVGLDMQVRGENID